MGIRLLKKGVWVALAFSIALNVGFIVTVARQETMGIKGRKLPGMKVLGEMNLPDAQKDRAVKTIRQMRRSHMKFMKEVWDEEEKIIGLIGQPGPLDTKAFEAHFLGIKQIIGRSLLDKAGHAIEMRNILGPENSVYFFSRVQKHFRERFAEGKIQG